MNIQSNINKNNTATLLLKLNDEICTQDGRAVRLLSDKCVRIELKLVSAHIVMLEFLFYLFYYFKDALSIFYTLDSMWMKLEN